MAKSKSKITVKSKSKRDVLPKAKTAKPMGQR